MALDHEIVFVSSRPWHIYRLFKFSIVFIFISCCTTTDERGPELPNRSTQRHGHLFRPAQHVPKPFGARPTLERNEDQRAPALLLGGAHHVPADVQVRLAQHRVRHVREATDTGVVRQGALARTRPDARRAVALSSVRARHLGPQTHLGGVPRAGQVDPAGRAEQDEGGSPGAVVDARNAAAGGGAGVLCRAAASVRYTKKQVKVASVASVRSFARPASLYCMHHCFDFVLRFIGDCLDSSHDTGLLRTRMDNQPFFPYRVSRQCCVYRMQPRLATHAGVIHHDFITPK